ADRALDAPRVLHGAAPAVELGAGALGVGGETFEPRRPVLDDPRHAGQGLDVVHRGRPAPQPARGGERRLGAGRGALALERVQECGLLATDVAPAALVDVDVERVAAARDAFAQERGRAGLLD